MNGNGANELLMDLSALGIAALGLAGIVLLRRWIMVRRRRTLPGLPPEPVLPLSHHGTLHDPKYLGRILEAEEQTPGP